VQRAVDCHRSQLPAYQHFASLQDEQQRTLWGSQTFYRALSLVNGGREIERDLFAGIPDKVDIKSLFNEEAMAGGLAASLFATNGTAFNQQMY
jgi:hypothetical protein